MVVIVSDKTNITFRPSIPERYLGYKVGRIISSQRSYSYSITHVRQKVQNNSRNGKW